MALNLYLAVQSGKYQLKMIGPANTERTSAGIAVPSPSQSQEWGTSTYTGTLAPVTVNLIGCKNSNYDK